MEHLIAGGMIQGLAAGRENGPVVDMVLAVSRGRGFAVRTDLGLVGTSLDLGVRRRPLRTAVGIPAVEVGSLGVGCWGRRKECKPAGVPRMVELKPLT